MSLRHAAALVACLPLGSLVLANINPELAYTTTDRLLLRLCNIVGSLAGVQPIDPSKATTDDAAPHLDSKEYERRLSLPREG